MKYLPYENFYIKTKLTREQIDQKLNEKVYIPKTFWTFKISEGKPYRGSMINNQFKIHRVIYHRNSFLPQIHGKIEPELNGNIIHIIMKLHPVVCLFELLFMGFVFFAGSLMVISQFHQGKLVPEFLLIFLMLGFLYCITMVFFKLESRNSKVFLLKLFDSEKITENFKSSGTN